MRWFAYAIAVLGLGAFDFGLWTYGFEQQAAAWIGLAFMLWTNGAILLGIAWDWRRR